MKSFKDGLVLDYRESQIQHTKIIRRRYDIAKYIEKENGINFLEVGVGSGDFTDSICSSIRVNKLTLVDIFPGYPDHLNRHGPSGEDQQAFVEDRFKNQANLTVIKGDSKNILARIYKHDPYLKYDFIYIDANHHFENVVSDIFWATMLLSPDGVIGIDDYCFAPPGAFEKHPEDAYEVQQGVSAFLNENPAWKIKYFSLNANGFQNVFLSRDFNNPE